MVTQKGKKGNGNKGRFGRGKRNRVKKWGKYNVEGKNGSTKISQQQNSHI
jgi:hypothetical protein